MKNSEVVTSFAQKNKVPGSSDTGNLWYDNYGKIYSYRMCIGMRNANGVLLVHANGPTQTTKQHISKLRGVAASNEEGHAVVDFDELESLGIKKDDIVSQRPNGFRASEQLWLEKDGEKFTMVNWSFYKKDYQIQSRYVPEFVTAYKGHHRIRGSLDFLRACVPQEHIRAASVGLCVFGGKKLFIAQPGISKQDVELLDPSLELIRSNYSFKAIHGDFVIGQVFHHHPINRKRKLIFNLNNDHQHDVPFDTWHKAVDSRQRIWWRGEKFDLYEAAVEPDFATD